MKSFSKKSIAITPFSLFLMGCQLPQTSGEVKALYHQRYTIENMKRLLSFRKESHCSLMISRFTEIKINCVSLRIKGTI
ncbi:hypothetical protein ABE48_06540 [Bacillus thuringiensis]|nr:hypothetical protein AT270_30775 [Bacillus cereus]MBG9523496.1 hypothetical protein [Bacillus thuringiensis]MBG9530833.1 hypothetical protein [Bacillus thuringiensis]MBG9937323.1 hypothetical protein [Bacillus tropicus]